MARKVVFNRQAVGNRLISRKKEQFNRKMLSREPLISWNGSLPGPNSDTGDDADESLQPASAQNPAPSSPWMRIRTHDMPQNRLVFSSN